MEIHDYVRTARSHLLVLILIPALAAGVAAAFVLTGPRTSAVTATITAPAGVGGTGSGQYAGGGGITRFVADFQAVSASVPVAREAAQRAHVKPSDIVGNVSVQQLNGSSLLQMTITTGNARAAAAIARETAAATLRYLFDDQLAGARQAEQQARAEVTKVQGELNAFSASTGLIVPDQDYQLRMSQILSLEQQAVAAKARGDAAGAAAIESDVANRRRALASVGAQLATFEDLNNQKQEALLSLTAAEQTLQQGLAQAAAANPNTVVQVGGVHATDLVVELVRKTVPAAAAGLALALGFVTILELLRRSRLSRVRTASDRRRAEHLIASGR